MLDQVLQISGVTPHHDLDLMQPDQTLDALTAKLVGTDADVIVAEANRLLDDHDAYLAMARAHNPFGDGKSAQRICDLLCEHS